MLTIELIYAYNCPNVIATRQQLIKTLVQKKLDVKWIEWEQSNINSPSYVSDYGSPTILINNQDVVSSAGTDCCRLYPDENGVLGVSPTITNISRKIDEVLASDSNRENQKTNSSKLLFRLSRPSLASLKKTILLLPSILIALIPKLTCPACWPAYSALLSSVGINFLNYSNYLLPLTVLF